MPESGMWHWPVHSHNHDLGALASSLANEATFVLKLNDDEGSSMSFWTPQVTVALGLFLYSHARACQSCPSSAWAHAWQVCSGTHPLQWMTGVVGPLLDQEQKFQHHLLPSSHWGRIHFIECGWELWFGYCTVNLGGWMRQQFTNYPAKWKLFGFTSDWFISRSETEDQDVLPWKQHSWREEDWSELAACQTAIDPHPFDLGTFLYEENPDYQQFQLVNCQVSLSRKDLFLD